MSRGMTSGPVATSSRRSTTRRTARLPDGPEPLARRDDVDLLVEDPVFLADADRHEEQAEDVVVVAFEARAGLVVVPCRLRQELERARVDRRRQGLVELVRGRIEQVDPLGHAAE